jgi:hypothetical protein
LLVPFQGDFLKIQVTFFFAGQGEYSFTIGFGGNTGNGIRHNSMLIKVENKNVLLHLNAALGRGKASL